MADRHPPLGPSVSPPASTTATAGSDTILETNMIFRAAAILAVVAGHAQLADVEGGAYFLLALAGFNFRRFKLPAFVRDDGPWPSLLRYQRKILTPYLIAVLAYFAWRRTMEVDVLYLYSNLLRTTGTAIFPIWFIQVLFQCTLLLSVPFAFAPVRRAATSHGFAFALVLLAACAVLAFAGDRAFDLDALYRRTPLSMMALVALGWAAASPRCGWQRAVVVVLIPCVAAAMTSGTTMLWLVIGLTSIVLVPTMRAPRAVKRGVDVVARASYYLFLLHMTAFHGLGMIGADAPFALFAGGVAFGLAGWYVIERRQAYRTLADAADRRWGWIRGAVVTALTPAARTAT